MLTHVRRFVGWRWYATLVLATWVFAPEVRRLVDWETSFHAVSPFSVLPLLSLVPALFLLPSSWKRIGAAYRQVSRLWLLAFIYAFGVAALSGSAFSAVYDLALFVSPLLLGLVLAGSANEDLATVFDRNANSILWLAALTSIYGIYQYVSPPPWDVYWAQQANIEGTQGVTQAFSFRIFGTLNSTGPLAEFLDLAILLNAPRLQRSRWWLGLLLVPCVIALTLTQVRSEWLGLALGLFIFLVLSPKRGTVFVTLGATAAIFVVAASMLLTLVNSEDANQTIDALSKRVSTFGDLSSDNSALSREDQTSNGIKEGWAEPLGQGLGASGGATKLSGGNGLGIDNGFVARFFEMGVFGFCVYEAALLMSIVYAFRVYRSYARRGSPQAANYMAVAVAAQICLFFGESSVDHHSALPGLFFWYTLFFVSAFAAPLGVRVEAKLRRAPIALAPSGT